MNVTREDAVHHLRSEEVTMKTKQRLLGYAAFLILWVLSGLLHILERSISRLGKYYMGILSLFGAVGTVFISKYSRAARKSHSARHYVANGFSGPCFCICCVWLNIVKPNNGLEVNAFGNSDYVRLCGNGLGLTAGYDCS